jgi:hypothetical protein
MLKSLPKQILDFPFCLFPGSIERDNRKRYQKGQKDSKFEENTRQGAEMKKKKQQRSLFNNQDFLPTQQNSFRQSGELTQVAKN